MNIVGIAACTSGIAHTYIAKEKLMKAGKALGHNIHIENADVVIIAADIKVGGKERFAGKKIVEVPTSIVIKSPKGLLNKIQAELGL